MNTIGGYRLLAEIARGGMGIVHLAMREASDELVVVKELRPELASDVVYRDMFVDEARLAKKMHHAHIVLTQELFCEEGRWLMAMELLRGASLHQVRAKLGSSGIPARFAIRILAGVLDGLHHAHENGVVHRDVSAQNVFLGWDGSVKLIDFGVAKTSASQATQVGIVKGSVPYLSPDHLEPKTIDRRADLFSVGILLAELLTGTRMWGDLPDLTILKRLIAREIPAWPMNEGGLAVPPGLRRIAERALASRREDRFATAAEMRDALLHVLDATDARGSLADVGAWLSKELATEKASFEAFVARAGRSAPPPLPKERWLPSSALVTRLVSLPPPEPSRSPQWPRSQPPARVRPLARTRVRPRTRLPLRSRLPIVALVGSILAGLAIGAYFGNETVDALHEDGTSHTAEPGSE